MKNFFYKYKEWWKNNVDFYVIFAFIISMYGFIFLKPYVIWNNQTIFLAPAFLLYVAVIAIYVYREKNLLAVHRPLLIGVALLLLLYTITLGFKAFFITNVFTLSLLLMVFIKKEDWVKIFSFFSSIIAISYIPGLIVFILILLNIDIKPESIINSFGNKYNHYIGSVIRLAPYGILQRFHGMFYEPGVVGTCSAFLLIADSFKLKKHRNKIHLLAGILSFSTAFFIIVILYLLVVNTKKFLIVILLLAFSVMLIPENTDLGHQIRYNFTQKLPFTKNDNRTTDEFDVKYQEYLNDLTTSKFLFGIGAENYYEEFKNTKSYSWKQEFIIHGVIYLVFLIGFILYVAYKFNNFTVFLFALLFIASIYQRPEVVNIYSVIMLFGGMYNILLSNPPIQFKFPFSNKAK